MSASILETCKLLTRWAFEYFDQTVIEEDQKASDVARSDPSAQPSNCVTLSMRPRDALKANHVPAVSTERRE